MPGGHVYSVLEGDGIYVPTEVSKCLECGELKKYKIIALKTLLFLFIVSKRNMRYLAMVCV